jgi:hypothetical protein
LSQPDKITGTKAKAGAAVVNITFIGFNAITSPLFYRKKLAVARIFSIFPLYEWKKPLYNKGYYGIE